MDIGGLFAAPPIISAGMLLSITPDGCHDAWNSYVFGLYPGDWEMSLTIP